MDNKEIYEKYDWESLTYAKLKAKIELIKSMIPGDVKNIIDIGCGNGVITNELSKEYKTTGVDRSRNALSFLKTDAIEASADNVPCEDQSYDMVFSSELLEHLPDGIYEGAIKEINRLSSKYVFISVPNGENVNKLAIKCPKCKFLYNRPNHLRSFDLNEFRQRFPQFDILTSTATGKPVRYYRPGILKIKLRLTPPTAWVPYYWIAKDSRGTVCPNCENEFDFKHRFNIISFGLDIINVLVSPKKPYWLLVLMKRKS